MATGGVWGSDSHLLSCAFDANPPPGSPAVAISHSHELSAATLGLLNDGQGSCACERVFARWCTNAAFAWNQLGPLTGLGRPGLKKKRKKVLDLLIHTEQRDAAGNNTHTHTHSHPLHAFHRRPYQFNQGLKNKQNFCTEVFVFGK